MLKNSSFWIGFPARRLIFVSFSSSQICKTFELNFPEILHSVYCVNGMSCSPTALLAVMFMYNRVRCIHV